MNERSSSIKTFRRRRRRRNCRGSFERGKIVVREEKEKEKEDTNNGADRPAPSLSLQTESAQKHKEVPLQSSMLRTDSGF